MICTISTIVVSCLWFLHYDCCELWFILSNVILSYLITLNSLLFCPVLSCPFLSPFTSISQYLYRLNNSSCGYIWFQASTILIFLSITLLIWILIISINMASMHVDYFWWLQLIDKSITLITCNDTYRTTWHYVTYLNVINAHHHFATTLSYLLLWSSLYLFSICCIASNMIVIIQGNLAADTEVYSASMYDIPKHLISS